MKNTSSEINKVLRDFRQEQNDRDQLFKLFVEQWQTMGEIVEDISKIQGIDDDDDDDNGDGGDGEGSTTSVKTRSSKKK